MSISAFDKQELTQIGEVRGMRPGEPPTPVFQSPITRRENFLRFLNGEKPMWMPHIKEVLMVNPSCVPDNWARGMVTLPGPPQIERMGGADMFGTVWEYMPNDHASMIRPGNYPVKDLEDWEEYVTIPDVDSWDWEGSSKAIHDMLHDGRIIQCSFMNGLFERLVSFVGMEEALVAMIDEEAEEDVHRIFDTLCNVYDKILCNMKKYFHADMVWFHDDWGTQRAPFFSEETARRMLLPYLTRVTQSVHKYGMKMNFHCCGLVEELVPVMIDAGVDLWDGQPLNDKAKILRQYGNCLICNASPRNVAPGADRAEVHEAIADFLQEYQGLRAYVGMHFAPHPAEYEEVYMQSRLLYSHE